MKSGMHLAETYAGYCFKAPHASYKFCPKKATTFSLQRYLSNLRSRASFWWKAKLPLELGKYLTALYQMFRIVWKLLMAVKIDKLIFLWKLSEQELTHITFKDISKNNSTYIIAPLFFCATKVLLKHLPFLSLNIFKLVNWRNTFLKWI